MPNYFKVCRFRQRRLSKCMTNFYPWFNKNVPQWYGNLRKQVLKMVSCSGGIDKRDLQQSASGDKFDFFQKFVTLSFNLYNIHEDTMSKSESSTNFIKIIQNGVTIVKFYSPTCPHCQNFAPVWDQLILTYGAKSKAKFSDVDCTQADFCEQQGIVGVPTLHVYNNGIKIDEYTEGWSFDEVLSFVKQYLD